MSTDEMSNTPEERPATQEELDAIRTKITRWLRKQELMARRARRMQRVKEGYQNTGKHWGSKKTKDKKISDRKKHRQQLKKVR